MPHQLTKDVLSHLNYLPRALVLTPLLILSFLFVRDNRGRVIKLLRSFIHHRSQFLFFLYAAFLLVVTIFARSTTNPYQSIFANFGFADPYYGINTEMVENIMLFIPYTYLYCCAFCPISPWRISLKVVIISSLFIEIFQLVFWLGEFQLSDLLHNTIGGIIGCAIWWFYSICKGKHMVTSA